EAPPGPGVCWPRNRKRPEEIPDDDARRGPQIDRSRDRPPDAREGAGARAEPVRSWNREGAGVEARGRHARVVAAEPRASEGVRLAGGLLPDELCGRGDAGRPGLREEAGARPGAPRRD